MKAFIGTFVGLAAIFLVAGACNVAQPPAPCLLGRADSSSYVVVYTLKPDQPACAQPLPIETWNMQKYGAPNAPDSKTIAIEPISLAPSVGPDGQTLAYADPDRSHSPYALGQLTSMTIDSSGRCQASDLAPAEQDAPTPVIYKIKGITFLADAAHQGGQFGADLLYTNGGCTAEYDVIGLYPAVSCTTDEDCDPDPDVAKGHISGSGISPDYPVHCDTGAGLCTVTGKFPQLLGQ